MRRLSLVTGANRGLGLEFVRQLLARGDRVVATCRQPGRASALNALAGEHPGRLHVLPLDVAHARSRDELVRELALAWSEDPPDRIDLLVNNAGVLHSGERWGHLDQALLEDSLRTNALGPLLLAQALDHWLAEGSVVANVSSMMASLADCDEFRSPGYGMSKAAQNMATVQMAHALAPRGCKVVALCPGWVRTEMGGPKAPVTPEASVAGLLRVLDGLGAQDSGRFIDWEGRALAW